MLPLNFQYNRSVQYNNSMFTVESTGRVYKFSNNFLKESYENFVQSSEVKHIFYKPDDDRNVIIYKDGTKTELDSYNELFEELIDKSHIIGPSYDLKLVLEKQEIERRRMANRGTVSTYQLFKSDVTTEEQDRLLSIIKESNPNLVFNDEYFFKELKKVKVQILSKTDWTQLPDVQASFTEEEKTNWLEYRAAIRSIDETTDPKAVRLPKPPKDIY